MKETVIAGENTGRQSEIITFPYGLIGLEAYRQFIIRAASEESAFWRLQSVEDENFGLVITNPFWFMPDYEFELPDQYAAQMTDTENMHVYVTVAVASDLKDCTVNLLGPIVISADLRTGFQVIAADRGYKAKHKLTELLAGG
ncbi:flagellar assembly factor fliw [Lucifera butyrica]|uniref:Flagellar assembly factor FliW n=1 Tax=Lucifera butyrica TaxID=1351585 RepID=A0A498RK70_9FIRM|nr:flagellar assembly protein FliW [Lucifera butyrica]VBB09438.1 flagellar assembly factor fliw [Lucifera butyrica]